VQWDLQGRIHKAEYTVQNTQGSGVGMHKAVIRVRAIQGSGNTQGSGIIQCSGSAQGSH